MSDHLLGPFGGSIAIAIAACTICDFAPSEWDRCFDVLCYELLFLYGVDMAFLWFCVWSLVGVGMSLLCVFLSEVFGVVVS